MNIVIANRQRTKKIETRLLKRVVRELLVELEVTDVELGINLVGEEEMTLLNETFLQHEGSTDVITFDHSPPGAQKPNASPQIHGELFICMDEAVSQARQFDTNWQSEVVRYVIHGILHLLGHDDLEAPERRKMKQVENRLLRRLSKRFALAKLAGVAKLRS